MAFFSNEPFYTANPRPYYLKTIKRWTESVEVFFYQKLDLDGNREMY